MANKDVVRCKMRHCFCSDAGWKRGYCQIRNIDYICSERHKKSGTRNSCMGEKKKKVVICEENHKTKRIVLGIRNKIFNSTFFTIV